MLRETGLNWAVTQEIPAYDIQAWKSIRSEEERRERAWSARLGHQLSARIPEGVQDLAQRAKGLLASTGASDEFAKAMQTALRGASYLPAEAGSRSVRRKAMLRRHEFPEDSPLADLQQLELEQLDRLSRGPSREIVGSAFTGAASGVAATTGTLAGVLAGAPTGGAAAAPGAAVVMGALASDAAATLAMTHRVVAKVAANYGYDTRIPDEELFALEVLGFASAGFFATKAQGTVPVSQLAQALARRKAWKELNKNVVTRVTRLVYARLGFRLTQRKLAQALPVIGIALGASMNAGGIQIAAQRARQAYRARHLMEKYGVDDLNRAAGLESAPAETSEEMSIVTSAIDEGLTQ